MKQKTRWAIEKALPYIKERLRKEPNGFKQFSAPPLYRPAIQAGISLGILKRNWVDGDALITISDTSMGVREKSPENGVIEQAILYVKYTTEKNNVESIIWASTPKCYHQGIYLAVDKGLLRRHFTKGNEYISLTTNGETAAYEVNHQKPDKSDQNFKIRPTRGDFMLDRGDFRKLARTLPNSEYIIQKINQIPIGDIDGLNKLKKSVCDYYKITD